MLEKGKIVMNAVLMAILVRAQKEKRRAGEKALSLLKEYIIIMNRMLVEIWAVKSTLMRSRMEIRNMLLDNGEKAILVIK